jgi:hypothetical protein
VPQIGDNEQLPILCEGLTPDELILSPGGPAYAQLSTIPVTCEGCEECSAQGVVHESACNRRLQYSLWNGIPDCEGNDETVRYFDLKLGEHCIADQGLSWDIDITSYTWSWKATWSDSPTVKPSCGEPAEVQEVRPPAFGQRWRACRPEPLAGQCPGTQICVAADLESEHTPYCIVRTGNHSCTDPNFPIEKHIYDDVEDRRHCTACTCEGDNSLECEYSVLAHDAAQCAGDIGSISNDHCYLNIDIPESSTSALVTIPGLENYCEAGGGKPFGTVEGLGEHTVCCTLEVNATARED